MDLKINYSWPTETVAHHNALAVLLEEKATAH